MEPERQIEKLLRAFAKKRREQAGDAAELRTSMRERLHREISRGTSGKGGGGFFASFFAGFRPRLVFAVCCIAIAVIGVWLLSPILTHPKPATLASADRESVNAPLPQPAAPPVMTPAPAADEAANAIVEKRADLPESAASKQAQPPGVANKPQVVIAANEIPAPVVLQNSVVQTNFFGGMNAASAAPSNPETLAYNRDKVPADSFADADALKDSANRALLPAERQIDTNLAMPTLSLAAAEPQAQKKLGVEGTPATEPAGGVVFENLVKSEAAKANTFASQNFHQVDVSGSRRASGASSLRAPLQSSFRVEQNGSAMRVVDADGSVYTGVVQVVSTERVPVATFAATAAKTRLQAPAVQNYFFRVAGTNRNLRQNVVFSGNLIPLTNILSRQTNAAGAGGSIGGPRAIPESPNSSLLLNSRISGKATIGKKETEVNATPAP